MTDLGWIEIPSWDRYQHADVTRSSSSAPPWIKTYTRLLHDDDYMSLSEHRALMLHRLWLEFASSACRLRAETRSLSRRLGLRVTRADLEALNHAGYIRFSASSAQAARKQNASASRARGEERREEKASSSQDEPELHYEGSARLEEESNENHKAQDEGEAPAHELVQSADDWGLEPLASTVEQLRQQWTERA